MLCFANSYKYCICEVLLMAVFIVVSEVLKMELVLVSIVLLESLIFGIYLWDQRKRNQMFTIGALVAFFLTVLKMIHGKEAIWGSFIVGHIILFAMYLIYYYGLINKIEKENLIMLFAKYIRISSFFYIISSVAVLYTMVGEIKTDEIAPVMVILLLNFIACIYTFVENKKFNNLSNELLAKMDRQELKQYIYRKNALIAVYAMIFSISMGTLYMCSIDFINENITVVIFILEFVFNMILYGNCYYKIKSKFMPEDNSQYNKWQLIVPKRVGVGYTFNFGCPLTYVILGILLAVIIVSIL